MTYGRAKKPPQGRPRRSCATSKTITSSTRPVCVNAWGCFALASCSEATLRHTGKQAATQFLQPQHDPVAQGSQYMLGSAQAPDPHEGAHCAASNRQTSLLPHGSSSSHMPTSAGIQAATQSAQTGQLDVAQPWQTDPASQESQ